MNKLKIITLSILSLLVLLPVKETYANSKTMKINVSYTIYTKGENNKDLDDIRWQVSSYNKIYQENSIKENNYYKITMSEETNYTDKIFSKLQRKLIDTIKETDDLKKQDNIECTYDETTKKYLCKLLLPTYFYLEEKQAPEGYAKEKYILPGKITLLYEIEKEFEKPTNITDKISNIVTKNYKVNMKEVLLESIDNGNYLDYTTENDDILLGNSYQEASSFWEKIQLRKNDSSNINITNYNKEIALEIKNYVNDSTNIKTTKNKKVIFKVVVKNIGEKNAVDSLVTSKLPDGFIYVKDSANKGGIYQNGEVHWNVDNILEKEELILTYEAYAPNSISVSKDYINSASISNFAIDNRLDSNKTIIKVLYVNPEYGVPIIILGFIITLVSILISILKRANKKQENFI